MFEDYQVWVCGGGVVGLCWVKGAKGEGKGDCGDWGIGEADLGNACLFRDLVLSKEIDEVVGGD